MNISEAFPGKYMKASDLQGREFNVTIDNCVMERVVENEPEKVILYFSGSEKGMVCNKTNALELASAYGDDTDYWRGKPAVLHSVKVSFNGKMVDGLRLRVNQTTEHPNPDPPLTQQEQAPPSQQAPPSRKWQPDDDLPF